MNKRIFCDMDGVLTDFASGFANKLNNNRHLSLIQKVLQEKNITKFTPSCFERTNPEYFELVDILAQTDACFWSHLKWLEGAKQLWNAIKIYDPIILTTPIDLASKLGKIEWCWFELGKHVNVIFSKHKYRYAQPDDILIDDYYKNILKWNSAGGIGIIYTPNNIQNIIKYVEDIYEKD